MLGPASQPCRKHSLTENPSEQQLPSCFSFLILSVSAVGGVATVPGGEVWCSPDHPAHLQCNSYSAFTPLAVFSLLAPIILFLYKIQQKASVCFLGSYIFSRLSGRPMQEQTREMMNENRQHSDF